MTPDTLYLTLAKSSLAAALAFGAPTMYAYTPAYSVGDQINLQYGYGYSSTCSYATLGVERTICRLMSVVDKAKQNVVNGEVVHPLSEQSFRLAVEFALHLESDTRDAYVDVDPDGEVYFEWYSDADNQCTVTFSCHDDRIHCMKDVGGKSSSMISTDCREILGMIGNVIRI